MKPRALYILVATLLLSVTVSNIKAEEKPPFKQDLRIGVKGGVNLSKVAFTPSKKEAFLIKYNGGIVTRWVTERHFGLQAELNYSMRGWEREFIDQTHIDKGYEYSRDMSYIEFPLMTHIYFGGKTARVFFNLGPQVGLFLSDKENIKNLDVSTVSDPVYFAEVGKPVENKFDWGICGGGGFEVNTRTGSYILEARYYFGLGNIFKNSRDIANGARKDPFSRSAFSLISVNVVYLIPIPTKAK